MTFFLASGGRRALGPRFAGAVGAALVGLWLGAIAPLAGEAAGPTPPPQAEAILVVASNRSGPWRIWSVRPDGAGLAELVRSSAAEHDVDPAIHPERNAILFSSTRGGTTGIWRVQLDGAKPERICDGDQAEWSPDGRSIVFRRDEAIWTRELASGREQRLTTPADWPHPSGPAWSPDGKTIAFACRWDGGNGIYVMPAAGGKPTLVYDRQGACEPHWSPDGERLVYETETHICTIGRDGKKNRTVTYFGGVQRYGRFSPDGRSIVFCQGATERGPWELYVIPAQGGTPRKLTEGGSDMTPDWK